MVDMATDPRPRVATTCGRTGPTATCPFTTTGHLWKCGRGPGSQNCRSPATLRIQLQHPQPIRLVQPLPAPLAGPIQSIPHLVRCVSSDPAEAAERSQGQGGCGTITGRPAEPPAGACGQTSGKSLPTKATPSPGLHQRTTAGRGDRRPGHCSTFHRGGEPPA